MEIKIDDKIYPVEIIKKNNRNTYIRVKNGKIIVTTNYLTPQMAIIKLIEDNKKSLVKMINTDDKKQDKVDNFYLFGKCYDVIYGFNEIEITDDKIYAPNKRELDKYLLNNIKKIYQARLNYWYNVFEEKLPVPNLKIRKMTSRWGVCNTKNHNITLNYELSKYDITCLDYVVVHELSHFIYHDHQREFWNLVGKYYPKYREARKMLKE
jgi:predicted metal-dependent hydrolase